MITLSGATLSLERTLAKLIIDAMESRSLTRSGAVNDADSESTDGWAYEIIILLAGDGFGIGTQKLVRVGASLASTSGLNCSPHDWLDFFAFFGKENWHSLELGWADAMTLINDLLPHRSHQRTNNSR